MAPTKYDLNSFTAIIMFCECSETDAECTASSLGCRKVTLKPCSPPVTLWADLQQVYRFEVRVREDLLVLVVSIVVFRAATFFSYAFINRIKR